MSGYEASYGRRCHWFLRRFAFLFNSGHSGFASLLANVTSKLITPKRKSPPGVQALYDALVNLSHPSAVWMFNMEYEHHEQRPLYFGEWY